MSTILKNKAFNQWRLFWLLTGPVSIAMLVLMAARDMSSAPGVSSMIQASVRCAVPLLYVTFAASSVQVLFPGLLGRWFLRNRRYLGLAFASAMAWQGFFILWMLTLHTDYYVNEVYVMRDAIEGVGGYLFLFLMTVTSFKSGRGMLTPKQWRVLHTVGIYYLWAYAFGVYWWNLFYYTNPVPLDYAYYWAGFGAWGMRVAAWAVNRQKSAVATAGGAPVTAQLVGGLIIGLGLFATAYGALWMATAHKYLLGYSVTRLAELYLPYWPFISYLPLFVIGFGAWIIARSSERATPTRQLAASGI